MKVRPQNSRAADGQSIAWGATPGRFPIPTVTPTEGESSAEARWLRAVALGGQGRYSLALAELNVAERGADVTRVERSLMASTTASWLRQMGEHQKAARFDGAAIAWVGMGTAGDSPLVAEARCDALTGLGADALGTGSFGAAEVALSRCESLLREHRHGCGLWRQRLRFHWVRAELSMFSGDGPSAVRHALTARELATETISLRHVTKTELIVAAAHSSVGNVEGSREGAYRVLDACSEHGLVPLRWAAAMLLSGLGEVTVAAPIVDECAALLKQRGGFLAGT
ncbi:hypothetical protein QMK17_05095 [Rhodococcus sp. G-MC3]|uniref:hypothetical protein n=1 Tax=Rhodococcus sp. G-MC3 TaxID=3046209 RepID=UPI0024B87A6B|nr:hypothetical protein [Rhodococcus sp. G-MC3]MDJ0392702.1 hypothetical protein [Rhodococcus sp. G-MC3]